MERDPNSILPDDGESDNKRKRSKGSEENEKKKRKPNKSEKQAIELLSPEDSELAKQKITLLADAISKDYSLRANLNDNPALGRELAGKDVLNYLKELYKNQELNREHSEIIDQIAAHMTPILSASLASGDAENFSSLLTNLSLTQSEAVARVQTIIYILENNKELRKQLNEMLGNNTDIVNAVNAILKELDSNPEKINFIKRAAISLKKDIEKLTGTDINTLLQATKDAKRHTFEQSKLDQDEIDKAKKTFPKPEVERRKLLHEDVIYRENEQETSRFQVLDNVATILRKYREEIKELIGPEARIKFRGSLVRGLKGYPKAGVAPTLDSYDCDAFIEVPDDWWAKLKKLRPAAKVSEDGKVRIKPLRAYESLEAIEIGVPGKRPKPILEARVKDEKNMEETLHKLLEIEQKIKMDLIEAKQTGKLSGYALNEQGEIDFEFYLRPASAVKHTYTEGNPYTRQMIEDRGFPSYAAAHETTEIPEFRQDVEGRFKRTILPAMLEKDKDGHKPEGIILEEYQAVIGRRNWYIEDQHLFDWRKGIHNTQRQSGKVHASRTGLPIYEEPMAPIQRDYLDPQYKDLASRRGNTKSTQPLVNGYFDFMHGRKAVSLQGTRNSFSEAHPIFKLGNAQDLIASCVYAPEEYFSIDKLKTLDETDIHILKDFFEADNEQTKFAREFLKDDEFPLYVKELIDVIKKTAEIPEENRANFLNDIMRTLQNYKEGANPYQIDQVLNETAAKYVESVKVESPVSNTAPRFVFGDKS